MIPLSWFEQVPKVELHLHLEGAIPLPTLWQLIQKYGGDPSVPTLDALIKKFHYRTFPEFIRTWAWKNRFLKAYEDFTLIAEAVALDLKRQNIRYAEVFFSPGDFFRYGLHTQKITEAVRRGLDRVDGIEVLLVADLVRDYGPKLGMKTLQDILEVRSLGIVGIGIGGSEQECPPEPFAPVYEAARQKGLRTNCHAGEAAGAQSIWGALQTLRVDRIGHGTRAEEDPELLAYLLDHQIPLEMCPLSNVRTGVVPNLESHPIKRYLKQGLLVTVNTDDPMMFGNSLAGEYQELTTRLGFTRDEIVMLMNNAVRASWMPEASKTEMTAQLAAHASSLI